jgi:capsular exopolysaccharide synthesis family protein
MENQSLTDDLRRYLGLVWRWAWLLALCALLAGVTAFIVSTRMTPVYQASTLVLVNEAPSTQALDMSTLQTSERLAQTYVQTMTTRPVLQGVIQRLNLGIDSEDLKKMIQASPVLNTQLIEIRVEDTRPQQAADIANALVEEFSSQNQAEQASRYAASKDTLSSQLTQLDQQIQAIGDRLAGLPDTPANQAERDQLQANLAQYRQTYASLLQSYEQVRLAEAQSTSSVIQKEPAVAPDVPVRPNTLKNTALAAVVGLMLAIGLVFLVEALDDTLKSPQEIEALFGVPVIGIVAHFDREQGDLVAEKLPRAPVSEAFRSLRTNLQFSSVDRPLRSLLVTSPSPMEGKSTIAANLAVVMAQGGHYVALADTDLRRPRVHKLFGLANQEGISSLFIPSVARSGDTVHLNGHLQQTNVSNLRAITSGSLPPNPSELLASERMGLILEQVEEQAELVVFDSPPVLAVTDAAVLAPRVDGVLLVVKPGVTRLAACRQSIEQLQRVGANLLGVVINDVEVRRLNYNYQYYQGYYSGHYYQDEAGSGKGKGGPQGGAKGAGQPADQPGRLLAALGKSLDGALQRVESLGKRLLRIDWRSFLP